MPPLARQVLAPPARQTPPSATHPFTWGVMLKVVGDSPVDTLSERSSWDAGKVSVITGVDSSSCDSTCGVRQAVSATVIDKSNELARTVWNFLIIGQRVYSSTTSSTTVSWCS